MSHRRTPFQFNPDLSSDERRSEILRRFGFQPEEDNMFYETNSPSWSTTDWASRFHRPGFYDDPEWRNTGSVFGNSGSGPGSPQTRLRRGWTTEHDEGGVPIKVVHEGSSSGAARGFHDDGDAASETSSQGSRSSCSSGRSGGASSSKTRHEPRVHHIPIMVEPRTGSGSSGYNSDGELRQGRKATAGSADHAAAGEPKYAHKVPIEVDGRAPSGHPRKPPQDLQDQDMTDGSESVRVIPIEVDYGGEARCKVDDEMNGPAAAERTWAQTFPRQKSQEASKNPAPASKSSSGGKLGPQGGSSSDKGSKAQHQKPKDQKQQKPAAEEQLRKLDVELVSLRQQVLGFKGTPGDKQFKYLDEMLTRLMLKLDMVDPAGDPTIRKLRKSMIKEVQQTLNRLEGKTPTDALIETGERALAEADDLSLSELESEAATPSTVSPSAMSPGSTTPNVTSPGKKSDTGTPSDALANPPEPPAKSEYVSFNETSSECQIQKDKEAKETPMEAEAAVSSEAQPSRNVEMPPAAGGGGSAEEVNLPELPPVPMPVDIDSSVNHLSADSAEQAGRGRGTPVNEQCLSSMDESEMERSLAETSIPTEHSGSTEL